MRNRNKQLADLCTPKSDTPPQYDEIPNAPANVLSGTADATNDGRVAVNFDSKVAQALARFVPVVNESDEIGPPPDYTNEPPWTLPMNIVMQVVGSRGDVQPFVALGNELQKSGHRVRIATHYFFEDFVKSANLEFYPIGGDPTELMAYMVKNPGLIPNIATLRNGEIGRKRKMIAEMLQGCWYSCIEPDPDSGVPFVANAIIANPVSFAHIHCAQALAIPLHLVFTMPWSPTRAFPHPLANVQNTSTDPRLANYLSYGLVQTFTWQGLGGIINKFRNSLDLEDLPLTEAPFLAETLKVPYTYCWSQALVPKPADWQSHIDVCGFIFRSNSIHNYEPPEALMSFLNAGPTPIYIGFGSIVVDNPAALLSTILSAVSQTGVRAIISKGWSNLSDTESSNPNLFYIGDCPHEYLFRQVSATIHHGGAGTTAASLLAGRPTFIIPFFGDQPFWGDRVASAGAGPPPVPYQKLTSENLSSAINFLLTEPAKLAAQKISQAMSSENGVQNAVKSFYHNLGQLALACDIFPSKPAVYELTLPAESRTLKVCTLAAGTLIKHDRIEAKQLRLYEPKPIVIENRRWDPVTSASSSALRASYDVLSSLNDIWYAPHKVRKEAQVQVQVQAQHAAGPSSQRPTSTSTSTSNPVAATAGETPKPSTAKMVGASAMSLPRLSGHVVKSFLVDTPYAIAEGCRNTPRLYGEHVAPHAPITDWRSGLRVGGHEFGVGMARGGVDLFVQPYRGAREDGARGFVVGVGKGCVGAVVKIWMAGLGVWAYPAQGVWRSVYDATHGRTRKSVFSARRIHDLYYARRDQEDEKKVLEAFERLRTA